MHVFAFTSVLLRMMTLGSATTPMYPFRGRCVTARMVVACLDKAA